MIQKSIRVTVKTGQVSEFPRRQKTRDQRMRNANGFVSVSVGQHCEHPELIQIDVRFESSDDLQDFMAMEHDSIERETGISELIADIETHVFELLWIADSLG